jgi:DNA-binding XRE family transcriptional regulator
MRLALSLARADMLIDELADKAGVKPQKINDYIDGRVLLSQPDFDWLSKIISMGKSKRKGNLMIKRQRSETDIHVGDRVRERRISLTMSQEQLGKQIGVSARQIEKYENGEERIVSSLLVKTARVLGVEASYFFAKPDGSKTNGRRTH